MMQAKRSLEHNGHIERLRELDGEFPDNSSEEESDSLGAVDFPGEDDSDGDIGPGDYIPDIPDPDFASPQMVVMRFRELFERHDTEEINILHRNQWLAILGELFPHITKEEADEIFDKTCGNGTHVDVIDYQKILSRMQDDIYEAPDSNPDVLLHKFLSKYFHMDDGPLSAEGALLAQIEELERWKRDIGQPAIEAVRELEFDIQEMEAHKDHVIGDLEAKVQALEDKNRALLDANTKIEMELIDAEDMLKNKQGGMSKLSTKTNDLQSALDIQTNDLTKMTEFLEMRHSTMEEQRIQIRRLEAEIRQLERLNQDLTHDVGDLNSQLHFANERAQNAEMRSKELKSQYLKDKDKIRKELTETKTKMRELQFEQSQMEMDQIYFGGLGDRRTSLYDQSNKRRMSMMSARESLLQINSSLTRRQNSSMSYSYHMSDVSPARQTLDNSVVELFEADESDSEDHKERIQELEDEMEHLRSRIKTLEAELSEKVQKETEMQSMLSEEIEKFRIKQVAINAEADAQIAKEKQSLERKYETQIAELTVKMEAERTHHEESMSSERLKFEELVLKERTTCESKVEKEREKFDERVANLEEKNRATIEKLKTMREQDLETQRIDHENALQKERESITENIAKSKEVEIARYKEWLETANKEANTYFMQVKSLKLEKDSVETQNMRLLESADEMKIREGQLKEDLQNLREELRVRKETETELRRKLDYLNSEKIGLQGELEVLESQRGKMQRKLSDLEIDHEETRATMRRRLSTVQEQRQSKEQTLKQMSDTVSLLQRELEQKTSHALLLQTKLDNLRTRYEKQEEGFMMSQATLQQMESDLSKMKTAHAILDQTHTHESSLLSETKEKLMEITTDRDQLMFTTENLQRQLDKTRQDKEELLLEVTNQSHAIQKQTTEIRLLTKATEEIEEMKMERVEIRKEQSKLIKEKENQNLEIIRIKGELEAKVEKFNRVERKLREQLVKSQEQEQEAKDAFSKMESEMKAKKLEGTNQKMQILELTHDKDTQILENNQLLAKVQKLKIVEEEHTELNKKHLDLQIELKTVKRKLEAKSKEFHDELQNKNNEIMELDGKVETKAIQNRMLQDRLDKLGEDLNEKKTVLEEKTEEIKTRKRKLTTTIKITDELKKGMTVRVRELEKVKSEMQILEEETLEHQIFLEAEQKKVEELNLANLELKMAKEEEKRDFEQKLQDVKRAKEDVQQKVMELEITNQQQATEMKLLRQLTQDVGALREKKAELQTEKAKLMSEKREADLKVIELSHANDRHEMELTKLREKLDFIQKEQEEKVGELVSHKKELDTQKQKKREMERRHTMTLENERALEKNLKAKANDIEDMQEQLEKLQSQNEQLKLNALEMEDQFADTVANLDSARKAQLDLKASINDLQQKLKDKESEKREVDLKVIELSHANERLEMELSKLREKLEFIQKEQEEQVGELMSHRKKLDTQKQQKREMERRHTLTLENERVLEKTLKAKANDIEDIQEQLEKLQSQNEQLKLNALDMEDQFADTVANLDTARKAQLDLKANINDLKKQLKDKEMEIMDLQHDGEAKQKTIERLNSEKSDIESEKQLIRMKSGELEDLQEQSSAEVRELSRQVKEMKDQVEDLEVDLELKTKQITRLKKLKAESDNSVADLEDTVKTQEKEIEQLRSADKNTKEETQMELKEKIMQIQDLTHDTHMKDRQIKKLRAEVDHLTDEGEEDRVKARAAKKEIRELKSKLDTIQHEHSIQEDDLKSVKERMEKAETQCRGLKKELSGVKMESEMEILNKEKERTRLLQKIAELETHMRGELSGKDDELAAGRKEILSLREQLSDSEESNQKLEKRIAKVRLEVNETAAALERKIHMLESMTSLKFSAFGGELPS